MKNIYIIKDIKNNLIFNEEFTKFMIKFPTHYTNKKEANEKINFAKRFCLDDAILEVITM